MEDAGDLRHISHTLDNLIERFDTSLRLDFTRRPLTEQIEMIFFFHERDMHDTAETLLNELPADQRIMVERRII